MVDRAGLALLCKSQQHGWSERITGTKREGMLVSQSLKSLGSPQWRRHQRLSCMLGSHGPGERGELDTLYCKKSPVERSGMRRHIIPWDLLLGSFVVRRRPIASGRCSFALPKVPRRVSTARANPCYVVGDNASLDAVDSLTSEEPLEFDEFLMPWVDCDPPRRSIARFLLRRLCFAS